MRKWWQSGFEHAKSKNKDLVNQFRPDLEAI
jgi:hypothetical protein